ncbi:LANO_0B05578g1_1 [Lachancea nothofagi CBS 11611]|uniref:LANO_0B05578g1_1 n=1 Tax=Lachancea nothofagi CBS 11611 TaxID=1266666 RepID=A0A1G4IYG0_9SACH|nr:LANO_0B05578g1_1 [Lachancea nothofagi CBS 11611]
MPPATSKARIDKQKSDLALLQTQNTSLLNKYQTLTGLHKIDKSAEEIMKEHIANLKKYNELRDTGLGLAQMIADEKSCKLSEVFEEMGYEMQDRL